MSTDVSVHELPDEDGQPQCSTEVVVNTALIARIEALEAENSQLKSEPKRKYFRPEDIDHDDNLVRFYAGFVSYCVFLAFLEFLEPVVNPLNYWGSKNKLESAITRGNLTRRTSSFSSW